jgi:hypothetical protein
MSAKWVSRFEIPTQSRQTSKMPLISSLQSTQSRYYSLQVRWKGWALQVALLLTRLLAWFDSKAENSRSRSSTGGHARSLQVCFESSWVLLQVLFLFCFDTQHIGSCSNSSILFLRWCRWNHVCFYCAKDLRFSLTSYFTIYRWKNRIFAYISFALHSSNTFF